MEPEAQLPPAPASRLERRAKAAADALRTLIRDAHVEQFGPLVQGRETLALPLPAVVTADLRLNTPRNAALPMVMKARSKPLATRAATEFGIDLTPRLAVEKISPPPERVAGRVLGSVADLAAVIAQDVAQMEAL